MVERVVPEGSRRRRRPTKQGAVLSERLIVETALRLVEQHGAAALSVRRLGAALAADPTALYRYFRNTDALLLALADELIGRAQEGWTATGDWRADLRAIGNPVASVGNRGTVVEGLRAAELVITQDAFADTETNAHADVILPAALWTETEGVLINSERSLTLARPAVDPPGEALADWRIIARVACAMGYEKAFSYDSAEEVFEE
ncbi:molybdopterin-dependent oxidoreductase, partial [Streptomyces massasporeus]